MYSLINHFSLPFRVFADAIIYPVYFPRVQEPAAIRPLGFPSFRRFSLFRDLNPMRQESADMNNPVIYFRLYGNFNTWRLEDAKLNSRGLLSPW